MYQHDEVKRLDRRAQAGVQDASLKQNIEEFWISFAKFDYTFQPWDDDQQPK